MSEPIDILLRKLDRIQESLDVIIDQMRDDSSCNRLESFRRQEENQ